MTGIGGVPHHEAQLCPVCQGSGQKHASFYASYHDGMTTAVVGGMVTCRGCGGSGWVIITTYHSVSGSGNSSVPVPRAP